jgi:uncharacterized protein (TIGR03083 family)
MMSTSDLLTHLDADAHLLGAAAVQGTEVSVPGCPDWTMTDLLSHIAAVHCRSSDIVEQGLVEAWPERAQLPEGMDPLDWYRNEASRLSRVLADADPNAPARTWATEQTIGFWMRRMAHETMVHRVDAEQAHGYESAVDPDLAMDGIEELLDTFITRYPEWGEFIASDDAVRVETGGRSWTVRLGRFVGGRRNKSYDLLKAVHDPDAEPAALVAGEPDRVLLWMWGRAPIEDVTVSGDPRVVDLLRQVCSI